MKSFLLNSFGQHCSTWETSAAKKVRKVSFLAGHLSHPKNWDCVSKEVTEIESGYLTVTHPNNNLNISDGSNKSPSYLGDISIVH